MDIVDIKKLGCEVLFTEFNPYVYSETKMAGKRQPHAFMEKHQIVLRPPVSTTIALFCWGSVR
jgi:hypothetical protein